MKKRPVILDSFALVSLFHRESGWQKVRDALRKLESSGEKAHLSLINLCLPPPTNHMS